VWLAAVLLPARAEFLTKPELRARLGELIISRTVLMGLTLSPAAVDTLVDFTELVFEANQRFNLSGIKTSEGIANTLILDSLTIASALPAAVVGPEVRPLRVIDVGSGAGIPGIPLRVMFGHWNIALIESVGKKARFLERVALELDLRDVCVLAERAETLGKQASWRDGADLCLARAVAPLPTLIELCAPLVAPGGWLVFPKSGDVLHEMRRARRAEQVFGIRPGLQRIPEEWGFGAQRCTYVGHKTGATPPGYPRRIGLARSRPIGSPA
jgi:16S rRNA (guanine527-N7)-methyltransferase